MKDSCMEAMTYCPSTVTTSSCAGVRVDGVKRSDVGRTTVRLGRLLATGAELVVGKQLDDPRQVLNDMRGETRSTAQGQGRQNGHAARLVR